MPGLKDEALLDVRAVAELLHLPSRAVYLLSEDRKLPHYKIGRRLRFSREQIEAFLAAQRVEA
jgi:excisionase family DNA binding protein